MTMPNNAPHNALARALARNDKAPIDWDVIAPPRPLIGAGKEPKPA